MINIKEIKQENYTMIQNNENTINFIFCGNKDFFYQVEIIIIQVEIKSYSNFKKLVKYNHGQSTNIFIYKVVDPCFGLQVSKLLIYKNNFNYYFKFL